MSNGNVITLTRNTYDEVLRELTLVNDLKTRIAELEAQLRVPATSTVGARNGHRPSANGWQATSEDLKFSAWLNRRINAMGLSARQVANLVSDEGESWSSSRIWEVQHGVKGRCGDVLRARLVALLG